MDERDPQRQRLADATRSVIRATRITQVDADALTKAAALLDEAAGLLEETTFDGPHCQVGHGFGTEITTKGPPPTLFAGTPSDFFPYSPVVGPFNPIAPPLDLVIGEEDVNGRPTKVVTATMTLSEAYNGPPWNLAHGGVIALVFDELLGNATIAETGGGFTGRLTVHYRKPTPILEPVELRGWVDQISGRKLIAKGEMRANGVVTAEAEGLFIQAGMSLSEMGEGQPVD